jgi:CheY-like chemotaxis protein
VVEDDPSVREVAVHFLEGAGYTVLVAESGQEALEVANGTIAAIHLLLTDLVMPGMSGMQVADALARRRAGLRVLFMSGYPRDPIAAGQAMDSNIEFLAKPFTQSALLAKVRELLD